MPKFVIEREIPGAAQMGGEELRGVAQQSNRVISELGPEIHWLTSYVAEDKVYCVYAAADEDILLEHARCAGIPADRIARIAAVIDPSTAD